MAPQLIFLTLTVLAVGVVVMIDRFAGRMAGDDDDVTAPAAARRGPVDPHAARPTRGGRLRR